MGLYIYIDENETKCYKSVSNKELNETFQEALQKCNSLLIDEVRYLKKKKGYKGWLLGEKEVKHTYNVYHESGGSQALYMFCASGSIERVFAYLFGIINGVNVFSDLQNKINNDKDTHTR